MLKDSKVYCVHNLQFIAKLILNKKTYMYNVGAKATTTIGLAFTW